MSDWPEEDDAKDQVSVMNSKLTSRLGPPRNCLVGMCEVTLHLFEMPVARRAPARTATKNSEETLLGKAVGVGLLPMLALPLALNEDENEDVSAPSPASTEETTTAGSVAWDCMIVTKGRKGIRGDSWGANTKMSK